MNLNAQKTMNAQLTIRLSKPIHNALLEIANSEKVSIRGRLRKRKKSYAKRVTRLEPSDTT